MDQVHFYFDFDCPYSYLAWTRLPGLARAAGVRMRYHAVDVEQVKRAAGNDGPALREIPAKRRYVEEDARRWARRYGAPLIFRDRDATLATLAVACMDQDAAADACIEAGFRALWALTAAPGGALQAIAEALGRRAEEVRAEAGSTSASAALAARCGAAAGRGVFGVPTFIVGDALFWGNDRLALVQSALAARSRATTR